LEMVILNMRDIVRCYLNMKNKNLFNEFKLKKMKEKKQFIIRCVTTNNYISNRPGR